MKRFMSLLCAMVLCVALTACKEQAPVTDIPEEPPMTTEFDEAITTYLSLLWKADPTAVDAAAPDALYTWLVSQGYGDKSAVKAYAEQESLNIQTNLYGEEIASFTFDLAEYEAYNEENTATIKQKLSLDYGIGKDTVVTAYKATIDSLGTGVSGALYAVDAVLITIVDIGGSYYIVESFDLINDFAYQLWLD